MGYLAEWAYDRALEQEVEEWEKKKKLKVKKEKEHKMRYFNIKTEFEIGEYFCFVITSNESTPLDLQTFCLQIGAEVNKYERIQAQAIVRDFGMLATVLVPKEYLKRRK